MMKLRFNELKRAALGAVLAAMLALNAQASFQMPFTCCAGWAGDLETAIFSAPDRAHDVCEACAVCHSPLQAGGTATVIPAPARFVRVMPGTAPRIGSRETVYRPPRG